MWLNFNVPVDDLNSVKAPVLVMGGDRDMVRLEHLLETFRALPRAQLAILPGTVHATLIERPEWFMDIVNAFLAEPMPEPEKCLQRSRPRSRSLPFRDVRLGRFSYVRRDEEEVYPTTGPDGVDGQPAPGSGAPRRPRMLI